MVCYLIRHGKDDDSVRGGWSDTSLIAEGVRQAQELGKYFEENNHFMQIHRIYSSDLPRAMQTATQIAQRLNLSVVAMPEFREVNNGKLAGMKNELAIKQYPNLFWNQLGWDEQYPGGESPKEFFERISTAWDCLQNELTKNDQNVVFVTHGGVIDVLLSIIHNVPYSNTLKIRRVENAQIIPIVYKNGVWTEIAERSTCHEI